MFLALAWALVAQRRADRPEERLAGQILDVADDLAPPVRMLVDGARDVDLLRVAGEILDRQDEQARRRAGDQPVQCHGDRLRKIVRRRSVAVADRAHVVRQQAVIGERVEQMEPLAGALGKRALDILLLQVAEATTRGEVVRAPPAGERMGVVGGDAGERLARVFRDGNEIVATLLEEKTT